MNDAILALADHDEATVRARHDAAHPPSQRALDDAAASLRTLGEDKRRLDELRRPLAERARGLESEAAAARGRASVIAERLSGATGAGRDLAAMEAERASLDARASQLEDELLEVLEQLEPLDAADAQLRGRAEDALRLRDDAAASVQRERDTAQHALGELEAARGELAGALDDDVLARYEAVAARTGGSGAARLLDGRCAGCRVAVPATIADRLAHGDPDAIAVCDECGRLLVR